MKNSHECVEKIGEPGTSLLKLTIYMYAYSWTTLGSKVSMNELTSLSCSDVTSLALGLLFPENEKVLLRFWKEVVVLERRM